MLIRFVDPSYIDFLSKYDTSVPGKNRPWLWPVRLDGIDYGVPLTTKETAAGHIGWLRCGANPDHGLYLRYMIPLPAYALQPARPLSQELKAELTYWELNRKYIEAECQLLRHLASSGQMADSFLRHSCNFSKLESVYAHWQPGKEAGLFLYPNKEEHGMPISKNGKPYYTKEQYEAARYNGNALEYARSQGYDLINQNGYFKLREHDSMVFTPNGRWFWNSRGLNGGAMEFMMYYEGKTITEAVLTLANDPEYTRGLPPERRDIPRQTAPAVRTASQPVPKEAFKLPDKASNFRYLFGYLCGSRGLEKSVVQEMIAQNRLYQSAVKLPGGKTVYNATFVYLDEKLNPIGAYQRGMMDPAAGKPAYKRDVPGSDKRYGWMLASPINPATEVRVFEAAIDAASDASLDAMLRPDQWKSVPADRLSLEGLSFQPLQTYLDAHPQIQKVTFMLDSDEPGIKAANEFSQRLRDMSYSGEIKVKSPVFGKDWNEVLTETRSMDAEARETSREQKRLTPEPSSSLSDEEKALQQFADENERTFWKMNDYLDRGGDIANLADWDQRDLFELSPDC